MALLLAGPCFKPVQARGDGGKSRVSGSGQIVQSQFIHGLSAAQ